MATLSVFSSRHIRLSLTLARSHENALNPLTSQPWIVQSPLTAICMLPSIKFLVLCKQFTNASANKRALMVKNISPKEVREGINQKHSHIMSNKKLKNTTIYMNITIYFGQGDCYSNGFQRKYIDSWKRSQNLDKEIVRFHLWKLYRF